MLLSIASILFSQNSVFFFANPFYDILSIKDDFPFRPYLNSEKKISITSNFIIGNSTSPNFDNFGNLYLMREKIVL